MQAGTLMTTVRCPSCDAPFMDKPSEVRAICAHCGTAFMYDGVGSHVPEYAVARLSDTEAVERVHDWASGVKGGKEFSRNMKLAKMTLRHFPLYIYGKARTGETITVISSAVPSMQPGIRIIDPKSVELKKLSAETDISDFTMPQTEPDAYSSLLSVDASTRKLVFYPFWLTQYVYHGKHPILSDTSSYAGILNCFSRCTGSASPPAASELHIHPEDFAETFHMGR